MKTFAQSTRTSLFSMFGGLQSPLSGSAALAEAAQRCTDAFFSEYKDSLALARIYVTVPYAQLPDFNRKFVDSLAAAKQVRVKDNTPVLSLMGTSGAKPAWNDRRKSEGHIGIPLVSAEFAESIPMVARLLRDLSSDLSWIDLPDPGIHVVKSDWAGLFHVPDATTTVDEKNRKVIPAQDFVKENGVRTVFGVGGSYPTGSLFAVMFFTREAVQREVAERFMPLGTTFKAATQDLLRAQKFFN